MLAVKILIGALLGAAAGVLLGKMRVCSGGQCSVSNNLIASIIACAIFGAAVAYALARS